MYIQAKHHRAMKCQDQYLAKVFPEPPLVGFRRQRNLKNHLIRAKVPAPAPIYPQRERKGMNKCGKCVICSFVKEGKDIVIPNKPKWSINKRVDCNSSNIVYLIECNIDTCKERYIGETERRLKDRLADHRAYVTSKVVTQPTGAHFNLPGHSVANLTVTILEKVKNKCAIYRKERERFYIQKLNTLHEGMNKRI